MNRVHAIRPVHVWVALMALTLLSVALAEGASMMRIALPTMFAIAAIKAELVMAQYMEIGAAQPHWQWLYRVWTGGVTLMLIAGHIVA